MPGRPAAIRLRRRSGVLPTFPVTVVCGLGSYEGGAHVFCNLDYLDSTIRDSPTGSLSLPQFEQTEADLLLLFAFWVNKECYFAEPARISTIA